jgi:hypothetical protein
MHDHVKTLLLLLAKYINQDRGYLAHLASTVEQSKDALVLIEHIQHASARTSHQSWDWPLLLVQLLEHQI